jgi:serine/threonine protein kinase
LQKNLQKTIFFQNDRETLQRIQMGDIDFDFELWQNISREAKHFVANLLVYKPEERMSVRQALAHPWLQVKAYLHPGCQMAYFQTKNPNLGNFCRVLQRKMLVNFTAIWSLLLPFGIFYLPLVYFIYLWYIFKPFGIFYLPLVYF